MLSSVFRSGNVLFQEIIVYHCKIIKLHKSEVFMQRSKKFFNNVAMDAPSGNCLFRRAISKKASQSIFVY